MDNVKIKISNEEIYIKKGIINLKFLYNYILYFFIINIIYLIFILKRKEKDFKNNYIYYFLENFNKLLYLIYIISFFVFIVCISIFLFSFLGNMHLETIFVSQNIKINGINYQIIIDYKILKEIKIIKYYRSNYSFSNRGTYYSHFKDKCTIIFVLKDGKEYEWGYSLSYQKGMEIKKILEERIKEKEV